MKLKEVIEKSTLFLKNKNVDSPRLDSEILIADVLKLKRVDLYLQFDRPLSDAETVKARELIIRRSKKEPVAYILGRKDFYRSRFSVGPGVLTPRPETEILVERAIEWLKKKPQAESLKALELGGGTGCIAISVALEVSNIEFDVIEKSEAAFKYLVANIESHKLGDRIRPILADANEFLSKSPEKKYDLIVSNPPYIASDDSNVQEDVLLFEPAEALYAADKGLACISNWSREAAQNWLKARGLMLFEIGSTQGFQAAEIFKNSRVFSKIEIIKDYSSLDRFVLGEKQNG